MCSAAGTYIAYHPWLDYLAAAGQTDRRLSGCKTLVKVGHSGRLGDRLYDSAYTTCWGEGWHYLAVFEVDTKEDAERVEGLALECLTDFRFDGRELVQITEQHTIERVKLIILHAAQTLGVEGKMVERPAYPRTAVEPSSSSLATTNGSAAKDAGSYEEMVNMLKGLRIDEGSSGPIERASAASKPAIDELGEGEALDDINLATSTSPQPLEDRQYQIEAAEACLSELGRIGRTTLLMACRCGKTRVAHMVIEKVSGSVLFLVPWIPLIRQTVQKLCSYGIPPKDVVMVGSGADLTTLPGRMADETGLGKMTTDPGLIRAKVAAIRKRGGKPVVVSTYKSSRLAVEECTYSLTIFDECHHICGKTTKAASYVLHHTSIETTGRRLFMTATPEYRPPVATSMKNHDLFGGIAYRYHLRQGIDSGYVNDFELRLVASSGEAFARLEELRVRDARVVEEQKGWRRFLGMVSRLFRGEKDLGSAAKPLEVRSENSEVRYRAAQVVLAMEHLTSQGAGSEKLLVFSRTIEMAESLCQEVAELSSILQAGTNKVWERMRLAVASSRTPKEERARIRADFQEAGLPMILFNCQLFQEGIEFPPLNGIFFASPKQSSRDIIQSMCRALTKVPGKGRSVIYIPVCPSPEDVASPLGRFGSILPYAEAIYSEDPRFYEHLLDPVGSPYPVGWLGVYGTADRLLHMARRAIRYGTMGRGGKDRLTANAMIPWGVAFAELERIVRECRRYPKTNDGFAYARALDFRDSDSPEAAAPQIINFESWYNWVREQYVKFKEGRPSALQPHQIKDLETLKDWTTRGVEGPYPFDECADTLERYLEKTKGVMFPINTINGGWIGLDASPMERLSGMLTTISQGDGQDQKKSRKNRGFNIPLEKAKRLDQIFGKWGLVWRKDRWYPEEEMQTVISAGHARDKAEAMRWLELNGHPGYLKTSGDVPGRGDYIGRRTVLQTAKDDFLRRAKADPDHALIQTHWPGYPLKHKFMEHVDVWEAGLAPPKIKRTRSGAQPQSKYELIQRGPAVSQLILAD